GVVLEALQGFRIDQVFERFVTEELPALSSSSEIGFARQLKGSLNVAPSGYCQIRKRMLQGEVHDENCASMGGVSLHAGLFGTLSGLTDYLIALWQSKS